MDEELLNELKAIRARIGTVSDEVIQQYLLLRLCHALEQLGTTTRRVQ
jgi:hypothetical protein